MSESGYSSDEDCFYRDQLRRLRKLYKIKGLVQKAAHGDIYVGTVRSSKEEAVFKIVKKVKTQSTIYNGQRVPAEAKFQYLACKADPDGTVRLMDVFEREKDYILVMEKPINSLDLLDFVNNYGQLDLKTTRQICRQLAKSSLLYDQIVHRDLKDENVMFDPMTGNTKIIDFGNACYSNSKQVDEFGTEAFYAPEHGSKNVDIEKLTTYTIGCIAFTILTGSSPFGTNFDFHRHVLFNHLLSKAERTLLSSLLCPEPRKRASLLDIVKM